MDKLDIQRGGWVRAARVPGSGTNYVVSGLTTDHDYNFRVYAENKIGVGEPLDMKASIKCKSPYSKTLSVFAVTYQSVIFMTYQPSAYS